MTGLAAGSALAADLAPPAPIGPVVSGFLDSYVGLGIFSGSGEVDPGEDLSLLIGAYGAISIPLGTNLSIQQDVSYEYGSQASNNDSDVINDLFLYSGQLGTHLSWRDPNAGLIGGFGGFGKANAADISNNYIFAGGEAQAYLGEWTLYGQGGWFDSESDWYYEAGLNDAFFVRGVARWFMTPDSRLQGEFSYASGEYGYYEDTATVLEWGVRYDWVWQDIPVVGALTGAMPLFVAYRGNFADGGGDSGELWANTFMVGTSYHFGGSNKQEFDRVGAPLDLPNIGRWTAAGTILDYGPPIAAPPNVDN